VERSIHDSPNRGSALLLLLLSTETGRESVEAEFGAVVVSKGGRGEEEEEGEEEGEGGEGSRRRELKTVAR